MHVVVGGRGGGLRGGCPRPAAEEHSICQHLFILPISSTGYTMAVESSPAGPTALVPLGDPD